MSEKEANAATQNGRLRMARELADMSVAEAAKRLDLTPQALSQIERGDRRRERVPKDLLDQAATLYDVDRVWLGMGLGAPREDTAGNAKPATAGLAPTAGITVPIRGRAAGAILNGFAFDGQPIGLCPCPPGLRSARGIYAFYVSGDSMNPTHPSGALRFASENLPLRVGDTVVAIYAAPGKSVRPARIKIFRGRRNGKVILEQLSPAGTIEEPGDSIDEMHRVLTTNELFGV